MQICSTSTLQLTQFLFSNTDMTTFQILSNLKEECLYLLKDSSLLQYFSTMIFTTPLQGSLNTLANSSCRAIHKQRSWEETEKCLAPLKRQSHGTPTHMTELSGLKYMDAISTGTIKGLFDLSDVWCLGLLKSNKITPKP